MTGERVADGSEPLLPVVALIWQPDNRPVEELTARAATSVWLMGCEPICSASSAFMKLYSLIGTLIVKDRS
jgi:hypothetical protein